MTMAANELRRVEELILLPGSWSQAGRIDAVHKLHERARSEATTVGPLTSDDLPGKPWQALERTLFGDPRKLIGQLDGGNLGFGASLIDGPDADLFAIAGFADNDELHDAVWSETNWRTLLDECGSLSVNALEEFEGAPGMSDTFYEIQVDNPIEFARELRFQMLERLRATIEPKGRVASKPSRNRASVRSVVVSVEWGDDVHQCPMALVTWNRITAGKKVMRVEPYWSEGRRFTGVWHFNESGRGSLLVTYDDGGVGFDGRLEDAHVLIAGRKLNR